MQRRFKIKDGVLLETTEVRIVDRTKLFKYNPNLRMLAEEIRRSRKDEHFENYLLKADKPKYDQDENVQGEVKMSKGDVENVQGEMSKDNVPELTDDELALPLEPY